MNVYMATDYLSTTDSYRVQKTIERPIFFEGTGLHSGAQTKIRLLPAPANHGIVFVRKDLSGDWRILAHYDAVVSTRMATSLGFKNRPEVRVETVEHLMAALYATGITNALIETWGQEIPILDGSASMFVEAILKAGIEFQPFTHPVLRVTKPIIVYHDGTVCELIPRDRLRLTTSVDFPHPSIGLQTFALELTPGSFRNQVARARTFGFSSDIEKLRAANLALGASIENVLAFSPEGILNPEGARYPDECVRHKLLDAIGDLALCGCWIEGELVSFRGGHSIHSKLLRSLNAFRTHWVMIPSAPFAAPLRREFAHRRAVL